MMAKVTLVRLTAIQLRQCVIIEVRMSKIAGELLTDLDKDTVDFVPNYDGTEQMLSSFTNKNTKPIG